MKFFAVLIALALTIPSFAQSDSIALLEKKLNQVQYQFYVLQSKVNIIDQDLNSFKNVSSDSIKLLIQKNEAIALRVDENGAKVDKQEMSIEMLEKTQHTQGGLLENFLWIGALGFLVILVLLVYSFIHHRKKLNVQRVLLERLFMDNLKTLESELKEISTANRQKTLALEVDFENMQKKSASEHEKIHAAIVDTEKELSKKLSALKQKITKNDKKFAAADKALADSVKKNEKLLKAKVDNLKSAVKEENEALLRKINSELKMSSKKVKDLQKEVQKNQKRKTVTFRVKKSS